MSSVKTVFLVPGFMSPAWMMYPLDQYLCGKYDSVVRWDYPRVFAELENTVTTLARKLDQHPPRSVAIVSHSFGDWIVRVALHEVTENPVAKLVSVCPVVTAVPFAKLAKKVTGDLIPEFAVMASDDRAKIAVPEQLNIDRRCIWARGEVIVKRPDDTFRDRKVWATHNSVLFQPNAWKVIDEELCQTH